MFVLDSFFSGCLIKNNKASQNDPPVVSDQSNVSFTLIHATEECKDAESNKADDVYQHPRNEGEIVDKVVPEVTDEKKGIETTEWTGILSDCAHL